MPSMECFAPIKREGYSFVNAGYSSFPFFFCITPHETNNQAKGCKFLVITTAEPQLMGDKTYNQNIFCSHQHCFSPNY